MSSLGITGAGQIGSDDLGSISDIEVVDSTVEELERGDGLIEGYLVTGFVDACEGKVAILAHFTVLDSIDGERLVACRSKFLGVSVFEGQGDGLTTKLECVRQEC